MNIKIVLIKMSSLSQEYTMRINIVHKWIDKTLRVI